MERYTDAFVDEEYRQPVSSFYFHRIEKNNWLDHIETLDATKMIIYQNKVLMAELGIPDD